VGYTPNDYGEMTVIDNITETTISSQNTWTKISQFARDGTSNVTVTDANFTLVQQ